MTPVEQVFNIARGAVVFVLILTVLVAVHELGHYMAARMYRMKVDAFAIFMGGIRKTPLDQYLDKPLPRVLELWTVIGVGTVLFAAGTWRSEAWLGILGLVLVGFIAPAMVATRLEQLYHMPPFKGVKRVAFTAVAGFALGYFGSGRGLAVSGPVALVWIGAAAVGAWVGLLAVYYSPLGAHVSDAVSDNHADEEMGHGALLIKGQTVRVRYRPIWHRITKSGTELALNAIPLGGFVKIHGAQPRDDGGEVDIEGGQYSKGPFARFVVFAAGPAFSLIAGVLILWAALLGQGKVAPATNVASKVVQDTPAAAAGLQDGDIFLAIDGQKVGSGLDATRLVRFAYDGEGESAVARPVIVTVLRKGQDLDFTIVPRVDKEATDVFEGEKLVAHRQVARLGVIFKPGFTPVDPGEAFVEALNTPAETVMSFVKIRSVKEARENVGGIGTVAVVTTSAASLGFWYVVRLAGLLSISLGIMNLLPIVPLDGGHMLVAVVEMFRGGKRLSPAVQGLVSNVGMIIIFMLFVTVMSADLHNFSGALAPVSAPTSGK